MTQTSSPLSFTAQSVRHGDTQLNVLRAGTRGGTPVVFVHGFSQSALAWRLQLQSTELAACDLAAVDLRGHGRSDKPAGTEPYTDGRQMADDLAAVLALFEGRPAVLIGWSYGGLVVADYLRHHGSEGVAGVAFVAAVTRIGVDGAMDVFGPKILQHVPALFAEDAEQAARTLDAFVQDCEAKPMAEADRLLALGYNMLVPPRVRAALFARVADNDDLLRTLPVPALVCHGSDDGVLLPQASESLAALLPHARLQRFAGAGHLPFAEQPQAFNRALRAFVQELARVPA